MPVRVSLQFARPTMRLARAICDGQGRLLAGRGTALDDRMVHALRKLAVQTVLVTGAENAPHWETIRPLDEELASLDARFAGTSQDGPLGEVRAAVARYLERRAARVAALEQPPNG